MAARLNLSCKIHSVITPCLVNIMVKVASKSIAKKETPVI